jgi:branched-chain amino acid transport system ATP-binding protein
MALFEAIHLQKRFGDQVVLEDISLSFEENQLNGIMGPNGAGKSTCFNVLTGVYKPDRGKILFQGRNIAGMPERKVARLGISRSFQLMNVFDEYSVLDNILVALPDIRPHSFDCIRNMTHNDALLAKAWSVIEKVGLENEALEIAENISYGKRRALEIAISLAADPIMLFLDEPTQGLGAEQTVLLAEMIKKLKSSVTIVIIEHDMNFLFGLADKISVIHWGQVITSGTPKEIRKNKWVMASQLGEAG